MKCELVLLAGSALKVLKQNLLEILQTNLP